MDLYLIDFYRAGIADGSLTREAAREMIQAVDLHDHPSQDNATVVVIGIG